MSTTHAADYSAAPAHEPTALDFAAEWSWTTLREAPAWVISLLVHIFVILALASAYFIIPQNEDLTVTTTIDEELNNEEYKFDATVTDMVGSDSQANTMSPSVEAAQKVGQEQQKQMEQLLEEKLLEVQIPVVDSVPTPHEAELVESFDATGATEHTGGTEGAIDRMTQEIAGSLRERKTLVVWLFDESVSMERRRNEIADRFETIYKQLGQLKETKDADNKALKTAAASFSLDTHMLTDDPVTDVSVLIPKIREIQEPDYGSPEKQARKTSSKQWARFTSVTKRFVAVIATT